MLFLKKRRISGLLIYAKNSGILWGTLSKRSKRSKEQRAMFKAIQDWFKDRARAKAKALDEERTARKRREEKSKAKAREELARRVKVITTKPCPHQAGNNCKETCVHFYKGEIWACLDIDTAEYDWYATSPRCRLWKD
jgi:hypothetical protein